MDNIIYKSLSNYYHALELNGYMPHSQAQKLLLLCFYRDFVMHDYRGLITKDDYHLIERALDCLWGSSCLIPYPDYLKMSKLNLGAMSELAQRVKNLEDTDVLKAFDADGTVNSDIIIISTDEED